MTIADEAQATIPPDLFAPDRPAATLAGEVLTVRASAITSCTRMLIGVATGWDVKPPPEPMQRRFDDGHLHEADILDRVVRRYSGELSGVQVGHQLSLVPNRVLVSGSSDAALTGLVEGLDGTECLVEAKSMSRAMFGEWLTQRFERFPAYAWQISIYMLAAGRASGLREWLPALMAVKNKDTGQCDFYPVPTPPISMARIRLRGIELWKAYRDVATNRARVETMTCDRAVYPCPLFYLHDRAETTPADDNAIGVDPVLDRLIFEYAEAQQLEASAANIKTECADKIRAYMAETGRSAWRNADGYQLSCRHANRTVTAWDKIKTDWPGLDPDAYKTTVPTKDPVVRVLAPTGKGQP